MLRTAAVAALLPVGMGVATAASTRPEANGLGGRQTLEGAVGAEFRLVSPDGVVTATLSAVRDLAHAPAGHPDAFSAVFQLGDADTTALSKGLVDVDGPGTQWRDMGLIIGGEPGRRIAVLLVDRRPVSVHLAYAARR